MFVTSAALSEAQTQVYPTEAVLVMVGGSGSMFGRHLASGQ